MFHLCNEITLLPTNNSKNVNLVSENTFTWEFSLTIYEKHYSVKRWVATVSLVPRPECAFSLRPHGDFAYF